MTKPSKLSLVLVCALAGAVVLIGGRPAASQRQVRTPPVRTPVVRPPVARNRNPEEQPPDPYAGTGVLVEAFVVQVDLAALYEMGVSPLGQEPHAVSAENILACLKDPEKATVVTGAKAVGIHGSQQGKMRQSETTYRPRTKVVKTNQGPRDTVEYRAYEHGQTFAVWPTVLSENTIVLRYEFAYSGSGARGEQQSNSEAPPDSVSWTWDGPASVNVGEPTIVGAAHDESRAIFLILTAHIANRT